MRIIQDSPKEWERIRQQEKTISNRQLEQQTQTIINTVKEGKDKALLALTKEFDKTDIQTIRVSSEEIEKAYQQCDPKLLDSLRKAKANIEDFHRRQLSDGYVVSETKGVVLGRVVRPIKRVGCYIPGGQAAYPSTLLMNVIPAQIAGCSEIALVSPPTSNGKINAVILAAAYLCGIDEVYQVGGAQAIAALAYGTESVAAVDKIFGPGNTFVAMAKKLVSGDVGIDMIAGPTEIVVVNDGTGNPDWVAADLIAQAEHDVNATSILLTTSSRFAQAVNRSLDIQCKKRNRREIIEQSLENRGYILVVDSLERACRWVNWIAPEHCALEIENPYEYLSLIDNAGSLFLGSYACEALGDYLAGINHTLPTSRTARYSSGLSVDDFVKKSTFVSYSKEALNTVKDDIVRIALAEGLDGHAYSVSVRFAGDENES